LLVPTYFPVGDLGVRKGMEALFEEGMSREEMTERAKRWRPYRSYAALYLWRITDDTESDSDSGPNEG